MDSLFCKLTIATSFYNAPPQILEVMDKEKSSQTFVCDGFFCLALSIGCFHRIFRNILMRSPLPALPFQFSSSHFIYVPAKHDDGIGRMPHRACAPAPVIRWASAFQLPAQKTGGGLNQLGLYIRAGNGGFVSAVVVSLGANRHHTAHDVPLS